MANVHGRESTHKKKEWEMKNSIIFFSLQVYLDNNTLLAYASEISFYSQIYFNHFLTSQKKNAKIASFATQSSNDVCMWDSKEMCVFISTLDEKRGE